VADEIVSVGIKIETTGADSAAAGLDKVAAAGAKLDQASSTVASGAQKVGKSLESLGASAKGAADPLSKVAESGEKLGPVFREASAQMSGMGASMGLVKAAAAGFLAEFTIGKFLQMRDSYLATADAITNLNTQLRLATGSAAGAKQAYGELLDIAQRSRVSFTELAQTYSSISRATQDLGVSSEQTLRLTETLAKAITISGVSAQSANAAMIQLSQGLSSGTLRGEELNSIMEQTPRVARALAQGLGVGIGALREMGKEGKLTGDIVTEALLKSSASIDQEFGKTATTVSQASTVLSNAVTDLVGKLDGITGESNRTAQSILKVANAMKAVSDEIDALNLKKLPPQLFGSGEDSGLAFGNALAQGSFLGRVATSIAQRTFDTEGQRNKRNAEADREAADQMEAAQAYFEAASAADKAAEKAQAAVDKFVNASSNMTVVQQKNAAQVKVLREFAEAVKGFANDSEQYLKARRALDNGLANIDANFKKKLEGPTDKSGAAKLKADAEAYASVIAQSEKRNALLAAEVEARRPLTALEKLSIELKEKEEELSRKNGTSRLAEVRALNEEAKSLVAAIELRKGFAEAKASELAAAVAVDAARKSTVDSLLGEAEAVEAQVKALKQETEAIGLTGVALALLTNKRVDDQIQALKNKATVADSGDEVEAIKRQIRALEALKEARIGNAQANVAADFAKESADAAKKSAEEWQKAYDQIGQGLTDSLFRAAESGKSFFQTLRDSIKGMFNNLVLKPIIQASVGSLTNAIGLTGSASGAAGGAQSALGSLVSLGSAANNLGSLYTAIFGSGATLASVGGGITAAGGITAGTIGAAQAGGLAFGTGAGAALGGGTALTGAGAVVAGGGTAAAGAVGGLYTALAAIPVWGWVAMAAVAVAAIFTGDRGGPKGGGSFSTTGERLFTPDTADAMVTKIGDGLTSSITGILRDFGATATGLQYGIGFDTDPQGKADNRIASFLRDASGRSIFDNTGGRDIGRDEANISKEMQIETKRLMLAALQAVGPTLENGFGEIFARLDPATAAPEAIDNLFTLAGQLKALGDAAERLPGVMGTIADLSAVSREKLIGFAGGLDSLTSNLQSYYQNFFTAEEQLANAGDNLRTDFAAVGLSFDALVADADGPRQAFRDIVEGMGEVTDSNMDAFAAVVALNPALKDWINAMEAARDAAREAAKQSASSIDNAFLTESDRFFQTFRELGLAIPNTTAEFQNLVRAQDTTTEEGRTLIATLLSVYGGFKAVDQAARDATNAVIRQALETSRSTVTSEMDALTRANGDLTQTLFELENPIRTTADRFLELGQSMQDTIDRMGQILGTGAVSLLDQLQAAVNTRTAIAGARVGLAGTIQDQQVQGFSNRRDFRGGISFLKGIENALFAELQTTTDPAGVAGKITQALTTRYQFEAQLITEADDLRRTSLEKEINRLESLIDIADRLRDTITDLQTGSLSALAPAAQVSVAATSFGSVLNRAQAGDVKALQALPGEATRFLTESQSFNASGGDYASVFTSVIDSLNSVGVSLADAPTQLSLAQSQLTATGTVVDNTGAMVVDLRRLDTALEARSTRESDAITALVTAIRDQIAADERTRDGIAIERNLQANRWSGLATTLESIDTSMNTLANNATLEGAR